MSFTNHAPCPSCGSRDNLAMYANGGEYCFGCEYFKKGEDDEDAQQNAAKPTTFTPVIGTMQGLKSRKISEATCAHFSYAVGAVDSEMAQICNVKDSSGTLVGQKIRFKGKKFKCLGTVSNDVLIGMHLWNSGRYLVITEGEIDMLSYGQATGCKFPVVSLPNGVQAAKKVMVNCKEYLDNFETIILAFDNDDAGKKGTADCLKILGDKGKSMVIQGYKDLNEALADGKIKEISTGIFNAKEHKPSAVLTVDDIMAKALKVPELGLSLPWEEATKTTLGLRRGEIHVVGAAPKIGKTEHQHQLIQHMTEEHNVKVGVMSLEEKPEKTAKKVAGKYMKKQFTKPPEIGLWTPEELKEGIETLRGKMEFYSSEGVRDYQEILDTIRWWAAQGIWFFIVDPLTALVAEYDSSTANDVLNEFMSKASSLCMELDLTMFMYSHVNPPKTGIPHDDGGRVLSSQFTGSRAMEKWAHYGWGISRNRNLSDPKERNISTQTLLFDREFGEWCEFKCFYNSTDNSYLSYKEFSGEEEEF
jgi:twinkle protein